MPGDTWKPGLACWLLSAFIHPIKASLPLPLAALPPLWVLSVMLWPQLHLREGDGELETLPGKPVDALGRVRWGLVRTCQHTTGALQTRIGPGGTILKP